MTSAENTFKLHWVWGVKRLPRQWQRQWQVAVGCCNCCRSRLLKCLSNPIGVSAATVAGQRERGTESGSWRRRRLLRCRRRRFVCPRKMVHVFHGVVVHVNDNVVVVVVVVAGNEQDKMRCLHSLISLVHCPAKRSPCIPTHAGRTKRLVS